jgi:hypothetical protein
MPAKLPVREKICELMPITSPRMLSSGPPELPGFTATSVWMKGTASRLGSPERFSRLVALMMPAVTVLLKPKGEPIAITHSPRAQLLGVADLHHRRLVASTLITATSLRVVRADHLGDQLALVAEAHRDLLGVLDHVRVGDDEAVGGHDEARAEAEGRSGPRGCWSGARGAPRRLLPGGCWSGMKRRKNSKKGSSSKVPGAAAGGCPACGC